MVEKVKLCIYTVSNRWKLRPLPFHIALNDLFLKSEDDNMNTDRDDTTPHSCAEDTSSIITELQRIAKNFLVGMKIIIRKLIL